MDGRYCINSLPRCGVKHDILYVAFQLNDKATVRTPFGNTEPFTIDEIVKVIHFSTQMSSQS